MALEYSFPFCLCVSASAYLFSVYLHVLGVVLPLPLSAISSPHLCTPTYNDSALVQTLILV